ncbi:hypothetical protein [Nocardia caishijiensis]|uniref:hypothetical protein n=1 Tax=Nocardia caishijiensis TaxID=184756 RepID=UPI0012EE0FCF|nr:hypothetical protein [Nocardia caishijiensis]
MATDEYFWPDDKEWARRARTAWPDTVQSLPVGSLVTGRVIGRQPFGVFIELDQKQDAIGLLRVTSLPLDTQLPLRGESVHGLVLWLESSNCQVIVVPRRVANRNSATSGQTPC